MVLFELLSIYTRLLPNLGLWNPLSVVGIESFITILRTVFNKMAFDVTALANVSRAGFFAAEVLKLHVMHLRTHHLSDLATVELHCGVCIHF